MEIRLVASCCHSSPHNRNFRSISKLIQPLCDDGQIEGLFHFPTKTPPTIKRGQTRQPIDSLSIKAMHGCHSLRRHERGGAHGIAAFSDLLGSPKAAMTDG